MQRRRFPLKVTWIVPLIALFGVLVGGCASADKSSNAITWTGPTAPPAVAR
jgi:hypothetical protein